MADSQKAEGSKAPIDRTIATIGGLVALVVSLNTAVSSCTKERIERYSNFRAAVKLEETYWMGLYNQYLQALGQPDPDEKLRTARLLGIYELAKHPTPDFREFDLRSLWAKEDPQRQAARDQIDGMRTALLKALSKEQSSDPAVAQTVAFDKASQNELRPRENGTVTVAAAQTTAVQASASIQDTASDYTTRVLAAGLPNGWDVDVFWCAGGDSAARYARAGAVASALAGASKAKLPYGSGVPAGRVRLRTLPQAVQQPGRFYPSGDAVVQDGGTGEQDAAVKLAAFVTTATRIPLSVKRSIGAKTPWYLSVFVCR